MVVGLQGGMACKEIVISRQVQYIIIQVPVFVELAPSFAEQVDADTMEKVLGALSDDHQEHAPGSWCGGPDHGPEAAVAGEPSRWKAAEPAAPQPQTDHGDWRMVRRRIGRSTVTERGEQSEHGDTEAREQHQGLQQEARRLRAATCLRAAARSMLGGLQPGGCDMRTPARAPAQVEPSDEALLEVAIQEAEQERRALSDQSQGVVAALKGSLRRLKYDRCYCGAENTADVVLAEETLVECCGKIPRGIMVKCVAQQCGQTCCLPCFLEQLGPGRRLLTAALAQDAGPAALEALHAVTGVPRRLLGLGAGEGQRGPAQSRRSKGCAAGDNAPRGLAPPAGAVKRR